MRSNPKLLALLAAIATTIPLSAEDKVAKQVPPDADQGVGQFVIAAEIREVVDESPACDDKATLQPGKYTLRLLVPKMAKDKQDVTFPAEVVIEGDSLSIKTKGMTGNRITLTGTQDQGEIKVGLVADEKGQKLKFEYAGKVTDSTSGEGTFRLLVDGNELFDGTWTLSQPETVGVIDEFERVYQLRILLLTQANAILDSIKDEATAEQAAVAWRKLFPIQAEAEYLEKDFLQAKRGLAASRADKETKYGEKLKELRERLFKRQGELEPLAYFQKVTTAQEEHAEELIGLKPFDIPHGHAWRADGPQFVLWLPPGATPEIDLSSEKGTLEVLVVDEATGELRPQRQNVSCGGKALLPLPDGKTGSLYWLRPVR